MEFSSCPLRHSRLNVVMGLVGFLGVVVFAHEPREETDHPLLDIAGPACRIGALFLPVFSLIMGQEWRWTRGRTLGSFAGAAVYLLLFLLVELCTMRPGRERLMDLSPFQNPEDDWMVLIPGLVLAGIGCAITQVETVLIAASAAPTRTSTMASAASATVCQVGSSVGTLRDSDVISTGVASHAIVARRTAGGGRE